MAGSTFYETGTASVANGGTTVTGSGTAWASVVQAGDLFLVPAQGIVAMITAVASNTSITIDAWPGTTISGAAYKIVFASDAIRQSERARRYAEIASQIANTGIGIDAFGDFADRDAYDAEATGFAFLSIDGDGDTITDPVIFLKNSSTSADWSAAVEITGPQGVQGDTGLIGVWEGPWLTATAYAVGDTVSQGGSSYICLEAHTSGTFSTDLAASKWELVAQKGDTGDSAYAIAVAEGFVGDEAAWLASLDGADGVSFVWRGAYNGATAYVANDTVSDQGASWIALQATTGNAPPTLPTTSNAYWELMANKGEDGAGTGDVVGPASATNNAIALFDGTSGELLKDSAVTIIDEDNMSSNSASAVPTQQSVKAYVDGKVPFTAASSSGPAQLDLAEDTDNGSHKVTVTAPSALAADATVTLPAGSLDLTDWRTGQIKFPASQSASSDANTLDDYSEFSWTPSLVFSGASVGVTYANRAGRGVKIGRTVYLWGYIQLSAKGSSTGYAAITGLPFAASSQVSFYGGGLPYYGGTTGITNAGCAVVASSSGITLYSLPGNIWSDGNFTNSTELVVSVMYQTAN